VPYPRSLIDDLAARAGADGAGRLLDLACGTGQLSFALHGCFGEVWAADQEPDMADTVRAKAKAAGIGNIRVLTSAAENLAAPEQSFDLIAIGNAFHRLHRETIAAIVFRRLRPGRCAALVWSDSPWVGEAPWQRALSAVKQRWMARTGAGDRVPPGYDLARRERPDLGILRDTGFGIVGRYEFLTAHEWTPDTLLGFMLSTSVLSHAALGERVAGFGADLRRELTACEPACRMRQTIRFAYDLARRPG